MKAGSSTTDPSAIERAITEDLIAAQIRLRFDKSVIRLIVGGLKTALAEAIPEGHAVIFTVTAPVLRRAKTAATLETWVRTGLPTGEVCKTIEENDVRVRLVADVQAYMPKVVGFVHNPESDARLILELAESHLLGRK
ncbi:hypothetical protein HFO72_04990 [Rhizobium laguerreae]|uniref:hypothetical protein n=1 Tax=Rhizobium laguerreae TaxID=1076926 RepID=UPI001C90ABFB|nr:hypothetical protein [Rhizobium laguerreae]MBY3090185.1 hypothetical protein [Rhizobium laguerreae]